MSKKKNVRTFIAEHYGLSAVDLVGMPFAEVADLAAEAFDAIGVQDADDDRDRSDWAAERGEAWASTHVRHDPRRIGGHR